MKFSRLLKARNTLGTIGGHWIRDFTVKISFRDQDGSQIREPMVTPNDQRRTNFFTASEYQMCLTGAATIEGKVSPSED